MPPLPESGPVSNNEPLAAESDDDVTLIPTTNTPEAEEDESEDLAADRLWKRRLEVEESMIDSKKKMQGSHRDAIESEMWLIAAAPLCLFPPLPTKKLRTDVGCLVPSRLLNLADE